MNAPYLFLGLFFGLAIGYAIGWQQRRKNAKIELLDHPIQRIADCDGPIRCTNCAEKRRCAAVGCVRLAEQCDPPLSIDSTAIPAKGGDQGGGK